MPSCNPINFRISSLISYMKFSANFQPSLGKIRRIKTEFQNSRIVEFLTQWPIQMSSCDPINYLISTLISYIKFSANIQPLLGKIRRIKTEFQNHMVTDLSTMADSNVKF